MTETTPTTIFLKDYTEPDFWIETVHLRFELGEESTKVTTTLSMQRNTNRPTDRPLILQGQDLTLENIVLNGEALTADQYTLSKTDLTIPSVPNTFAAIDASSASSSALTLPSRLASRSRMANRRSSP